MCTELCGLILLTFVLNQEKLYLVRILM
jgi:hypothetical protein